MRINAFREELASLFAAFAPARHPALRRSQRAEWLYATDLPGLCNPDRREAILSRLAEAGWETLEEEGWLQLRKPAPEPPDGWFDGPFGPEAVCCLSLLRRHPGGTDGERTQCLLIKAGEEGAGAYEEACAELHRDWAAMLREQKKLPAVSRRYFGE